MKTVYVIHDERGGGWAVNDPIEGWIFTTLDSSATEFATVEEAKTAMRQHYGTSRAQLIVQERIKVKFTKSERIW